MILTYLYCVLVVAKYRGDWGWEKQKRASELVLIYPSSSWANYRFYTMVPLRSLIWLVASILTGMWLLCIAAHGYVLRPFYCSPFHVIKGWLCIAAHGSALRLFYCSSFPCDKRMTVHGCALGPLYCFSFPCDKLVRWLRLSLFVFVFILVCCSGV